jgi:hypothetical protein
MIKAPEYQDLRVPVIIGYSDPAAGRSGLKTAAELVFWYLVYLVAAVAKIDIASFSRRTPAIVRSIPRRGGLISTEMLRLPE